MKFMTHLRMALFPSAPATLPAGEGALYFKSDGNLYKKIGATETAVGGSGGGGVSLLDVYPVGAIYMSVSPTSPATLFGGTWSAWGSGRVPIGVDTGQTEFNTVEKTGGEKTATLSTANLPAHSHGMGGWAIVSLTQENYFAAAVSNSPVAANRKMIAYDHTAAGAAETASIVEISATQNSGSGTAHNNLQPYITCYMWKRVG